MSPDEDVVALVVEGEDLAAFELGLLGEEAFEEVGGENTEGRFEVI